MRDEYQVENNRNRARRNYYTYRDRKDDKDYKEALERVRILNRDIALMNEVREIAKKILSR